MQYLHLIRVPKHRYAFTKFITSSYCLAIERLRWSQRYQPAVPREESL
jgi:hypothetical protein